MRPQRAGSSPCILLSDPLGEKRPGLHRLQRLERPPLPHLLRFLPDEQMRNAHRAAAALRKPPPHHRTENDTGVARLKCSQESEGVCMGQGQASLELWPVDPSSSQVCLVCTWRAAGTWYRLPELTNDDVRFETNKKLTHTVTLLSHEERFV